MSLLSTVFLHERLGVCVHDPGEASALFWFTVPFIEGETCRERQTNLS